MSGAEQYRTTRFSWAYVRRLPFIPSLVLVLLLGAVSIRTIDARKETAQAENRFRHKNAAMATILERLREGHNVDIPRELRTVHRICTKHHGDDGAVSALIADDSVANYFRLWNRHEQQLAAAATTAATPAPAVPQDRPEVAAARTTTGKFL